MDGWMDRQTDKWMDEMMSRQLLMSILYRNHFPSETVHTLREHSDEVWYLQFSHDGNQLASGCKDGYIVVWILQVNITIHVNITIRVHNIHHCTSDCPTLC